MTSYKNPDPKQTQIESHREKKSLQNPGGAWGGTGQIAYLDNTRCREVGISVQGLILGSGKGGEIR